MYVAGRWCGGLQEDGQLIRADRLRGDTASWKNGGNRRNHPTMDEDLYNSPSKIDEHKHTFDFTLHINMPMSKG